MDTKLYYVGVVDKERDKIYGVRFPDFPGCISAGNSIEELVRMGEEALSLHIESMIEEKEDIPEPTELERIKNNPDYKDAYAYMFFGVEIPNMHTRRINISIPEYILKRTDKFAKRKKMNRSKVITEALQEYIN